MEELNFIDDIKLSSLIKHINESYTVNMESSYTWGKSVHEISRPNKSGNTSQRIRLIGEQAVKFNTIVQQIQKVTDKNTTILYSPRGIESLIETAILDSVFGSDEDEENLSFTERKNLSLERLNRDLKNLPKQFQVLIPVRDVGLSVAEISFAKVKFISKEDKQTIDEFKSKLSELTTCFFNRHFEATVVAQIIITANDEHAARTKAVSILQETLDVINAFRDFYHFGDTYKIIHLSRTVTDSQLASLSLNDNQGASWEREIPVFYKEYDLIEIKSENIPGIKKIEEILQCQEKTELAKLLIRSLAFCGRASATLSDKDKFLYYMIAIECILKKTTEQDGITKLIKKRYVALMSSKTDNSDIGKTFEELYDHRSAVVHAGEYNFSLVELSEMKNFAKAMLYELINNEEYASMSCQKELHDYLETK
jgi:hypothetical protein